MPTPLLCAGTLEQAFHEVLPALLSLPDSAVETPHPSAAGSTTWVVGAMELVTPYQADLTRAFGDQAIRLDDLRTRAFAMLHAFVALPADSDIGTLGTNGPQITDVTSATDLDLDLPALTALTAEGLAVRERLLEAATTTALSPEESATIDALREAFGHPDLAPDLLALAALLNGHPDAPTAHRLGTRLVAHHAHTTASPPLRARAYTHFVHPYETARAQLASLAAPHTHVLPNLFRSRHHQHTSPPSSGSGKLTTEADAPPKSAHIPTGTTASQAEGEPKQAIAG